MSMPAATCWATMSSTALAVSASNAAASIVLALLAAEDEIDQRLRPRQAAGVGGENAVGAGFHVVLPASGVGGRYSIGCVVAGPPRGVVYAANDP